MFSSNTETGITATYQDSDGTIDLVLGSVTDLSDVTSAGSGAIITSDERTKLNGIEANADITDSTNVEAAGALMDSELTDLEGVKGVTISTLQVKPTIVFSSTTYSISTSSISVPYGLNNLDIPSDGNYLITVSFLWRQTSGSQFSRMFVGIYKNDTTNLISLGNTTSSNLYTDTGWSGWGYFRGRGGSTGTGVEIWVPEYIIYKGAFMEDDEISIKLRCHSAYPISIKNVSIIAQLV